MKWKGWTVRIDRKGNVTLRNKKGRSVAWNAIGSDPDQIAAEWLKTYRGSTLDDRRDNLLGPLGPIIGL